MKIRTQIALAFLSLAILPMCAIVFFGYSSSLRAVREAVEAEAATLTADMETRMVQVRGEIARRVEQLSELPFSEFALAGEDDEQRDALFTSVMTGLGETAPFVESFEFVPEVQAIAPASGADGEATSPSSELEQLPRNRQPPHPPRHRPGALPPPSRRAPIVVDMHAMHETVLESLKRVSPDLLPEGVDTEELLRRAERGLAAIETTRFEIETGEIPSIDEDFLTRAASAALAEGDPEGTSYRFVFEPEVEIPVYEEGAMVGEIRALVKNEALLTSVLNRTRRARGEVPFAFDDEGHIYSANEADQAVVEELDLEAAALNGTLVSGQLVNNWLVVTTDAPDSDLTFGIARPIRDSLAEIRSTAIRNLGFGTGLIGLALLGVLPLSRRMTKGLNMVTEGANRLAAGDLDARVEIESANEIGQLARAFNGMAADLKENQAKLVEGELLQVEYDRKTRELEEARRFQLSLLPKELPEHPSYDIAAAMRTATEVGGDYYDFRSGSDGTLTIAIGDATGHGAKAGTMVTVVKSLFSAYPPHGDLSEFQRSAAAAIKRMALGRMSMALTLARLAGNKLTWSAAGMPPALLHRGSSGRVEELSLEGMPLGGLDYSYRERSAELDPGDTLLLMTDGFPELLDPEGETLGYERAASLFSEVAAETHDPAELLAGLSSAVKDWAGGEALADDVTFVAIRIR